MKKTFVEFFRDELPSALEGYVRRDDPNFKITQKENKKIDDLLKPYEVYMKPEVYKCTLLSFKSLFVTIRIKKDGLSFSFKRHRNWEEGKIQVEQISDLINKFDREDILKNPFLDNVVFKFKDGSKVKLNGLHSDLLFETFFSLLKGIDVEAYHSMPIEVQKLIYFKGLYECQLAGKLKRVKRKYTPDLTRDEYEIMQQKEIAKELHKYLKKFTTLSKQQNVSTNELRLIQDFINLSAFSNKIVDLPLLRNWITR